jgi:hypothetical protein
MTVDDMMDDIGEQMEVASEISSALSMPIGGEDDDEQLDAELAALEDEMSMDSAPTSAFLAPSETEVNWICVKEKRRITIVLFDCFCRSEMIWQSDWRNCAAHRQSCRHK